MNLKKLTRAKELLPAERSIVQEDFRQPGVSEDVLSLFNLSAIEISPEKAARVLNRKLKYIVEKLSSQSNHPISGQNR